MSDIADKLRAAREFIVNRQCFCTRIAATCERCAALAVFPDPDAVGVLIAYAEDLDNGRAPDFNAARAALAKLEEKP